MISLVTIFRIVAFLEGISYILLFSNMLIIKPMHLEIYQTLLFPIGMAHGLLFVAYIFLALMVSSQLNWSYKTLGIVLLASLIPFGTFYIEKKYLKPANE